MKEFVAKNPKVVGAILGVVLSGLLGLAGLKLSDVCAVPAGQPAPAAASPVMQEK